MSQVTPPVPVSTPHPPCTKRRQWGGWWEIALKAYRWDPLQRRNFLCCGVNTTTQHCAKKMRLAEVWNGLAAKVTSLIRSHAIPFFVTALPLRWDKKVMYRKPLNYSWSNFCRFGTSVPWFIFCFRFWFAIWWPMGISIGKAGNRYLDFILALYAGLGIRMWKQWPEIEDD